MAHLKYYNDEIKINSSGETNFYSEYEAEYHDGN